MKAPRLPKENTKLKLKATEQTEQTCNDTAMIFSSYWQRLRLNDAFLTIVPKPDCMVVTWEPFLSKVYALS